MAKNKKRKRSGGNRPPAAGGRGTPDTQATQLGRSGRACNSPAGSTKRHITSGRRHRPHWTHGILVLAAVAAVGVALVLCWLRDDATSLVLAVTGLVAILLNRSA